MEFTTVHSPLGDLLLAASHDTIKGIWFEGQKYEPTPDRHWVENPDNAALRQCADELQAFFDGTSKGFTLKVAPEGTDFQQSVWRALTTIPPGETVTYGELAAQLGKPSAVRAVAAAIGKNPISVVIPCHRVIGANGSLTGYAGGLERKQALLSLEGALPVT